MNINKYIEGSIWQINFGEFNEENKQNLVAGIRPALIIHSSMNKATVIPLTTSKFHSVSGQTYEITKDVFSVPLYQDVMTVKHSDFIDKFYGIINADKFDEIIKTYYDILRKKLSINSELLFDQDYDKDIINSYLIQEEKINSDGSFNLDELSSVVHKKTHIQFMYTIVYSLYIKEVVLINVDNYLVKKAMSKSIGIYFDDNKIVIRKNSHRVFAGMMTRNKNISSNHFPELSKVFIKGAEEGYVLQNVNPLRNSNIEFDCRDSFGGSDDVFIIIDLNKLNDEFLRNGINRTYMIDSIKESIIQDIAVADSNYQESFTDDIIDSCK